ncbi:vitronectin [Rhinophrynus dorsalis]
MRELLLPALIVLSGALNVAQAAEDSCTGRCFDGFDSSKKCQCDTLCTYYESCCNDYVSVCHPKETRGDVFVGPEDEYEYETFTGDPSLLILSTEAEKDKVIQKSTAAADDTVETTASTLVTETLTTESLGTEGIATEALETSTVVEEEPEETTEELCSGKPFDAFTNLKNGSIYAFRGKYFYELDNKKALEGYPKLIKDVWGIEGPIDAAFTRMNCQGKTFLFKGKEYWRFSDGVMDAGYPRDIEEGFSNIPDSIDAAFALPADSYKGKEQAYFFKGSRYWIYEFKNQPSWKDCQDSSPSELFTQYVRLQDDSWEDFFTMLFGSWKTSNTIGPRYISRTWKGVPNGVDAVLPSRIYVPKEKKSSLRRSKRRKYRRRKNQKRKSTTLDDLFDEIGSLFDDDEDDDPDWLPPPSPVRCQPTQNVYFFKKDKYYRVNLHTKRVDNAYPRYPRPIAQYWLGCKETSRRKSPRLHS